MQVPENAESKYAESKYAYRKMVKSPNAPEVLTT